LNRKVLLIGAALALPVLLVLGFNLGRDPKNVRTPMIGRLAPSFDLRRAGASDRVSLAALRGRPAVINFWATWCVPCYAEHPILVNAAAQNPDVAFAGVVYDDTEPKVLEFLREYGASYPSLIDDGGRTAIAYGVYGVPETFFVNAEGVIVSKVTGPVDEQKLAENLAKARGGAR
jgi:cytochrome c biogenesis protein CcmG, thiol:disulfide interchange protein DsbE